MGKSSVCAAAIPCHFPQHCRMLLVCTRSLIYGFYLQFSYRSIVAIPNYVSFFQGNFSKSPSKVYGTDQRLSKSNKNINVCGLQNQCFHTNMYLVLFLDLECNMYEKLVKYSMAMILVIEFDFMI